MLFFFVRHSVNKFGDSNSVLIQFRPVFKRYDVASPAIYCNFKNRSSPYGINYGQFLKIDGELNNVEEIEVWGCASPETLLEQQKQKKRQMNQAERNAKVFFLMLFKVNYSCGQNLKFFCVFLHFFFKIFFLSYIRLLLKKIFSNFLRFRMVYNL